MAVIHDDRACDEFMEWNPGFSPKDHVEMKFMREQLAEQRAWQERMDRRNRVTMLLCAAIGIGAALAGTALGYLLKGI
ncbi:MAG: hypothetical protein ABI619_12715 [Betaproteobacteria bacterium]